MDGPVEVQKQDGWKYKKTILLQKNCDKERLEDYFTSVG